MNTPSDKEVMELALQAGHILLENGAEIFRVEETMDRICRHYGVQSGNEFVLSNGIFVTAGTPCGTDRVSGSEMCGCHCIGDCIYL